MNTTLVVKEQKKAIIYPERDGKPMGETDTHRHWIMWLIMMFKQYFAHEQTYVSGDLLLYYEEGNPRRFVVPDVFVVKDHPNHDRRVYKLWEEKRIPDIVFEITSPGTKKIDLGSKVELYARLGVQEYFLYDPLNEYLKPSLQGYTLVNGLYVELRPVESGVFDSQVLGLRLRLNQRALELYLPNGERLLTPEEQIEIEIERAQAEAQRAEEEAQRANEAEVRLVKLEEELRELRRQLGQV